MSAPARASLQSFLAAARAALCGPASQRPSPLTVVVGNESADLDSLCCAVVYSYVRSQAAGGSLHVPLANLPRADLALRPELTAVLGQAGLRPADLPTLSELPGDDDDGLAGTRWLLVDHNALTGRLARFAPRVAGCIDHHVDEGRVPRDARPRVVEPCGSCMSLVVDDIRPAWDALPDDDDDDAALAKMALAPVLVDTVDLSAANKVVDKDRRAVAYLLARLPPPFDRDAFYRHLAAVKRDLSGLSLRDVLRKDYKQWSEAGLALGVSSCVRGLDYLLDDKAAGRPRALLDALDAWAAERSLDLVVVNSASSDPDSPDGRFRRELLVWGRGPRAVAAVARFVDLAARPLRLESWRGGCLDDGADRFAWHQHELSASRKKIAPLLRQAMREAPPAEKHAL